MEKSICRQCHKLKPRIQFLFNRWSVENFGCEPVFTSLCSSCGKRNLKDRETEEQQQQCEVLQAVVYRIRHQQSGMIKIGISDNWERRARELKVGDSTELLGLTDFDSFDEAATVEKQAHKLLDSNRLPQSEWFCISEKVASFAVYEATLRVAAPEIWKEFKSEEAQKHLIQAIGGLRRERKRLTHNPPMPEESRPRTMESALAML